MSDTYQSVTTALLALRDQLTPHSPDPAAIPGFVHATLAALFTHHSGGKSLNQSELSMSLQSVHERVKGLCLPIVSTEAKASEIALAFMNELPNFHAVLREDAQAIFQGDPAAKSVDEVILAYPGFLAIAVYRIAHWLHRYDISLLPRMISEYAHRVTGIEIHPGAEIGRSFVIDHGTGIVIGETTIIHDNVKIYQGVTLGALSVSKAMANKKRHPTIERDVIIYANATILGGDTVIGSGSIIGGNVWLTESIPAGSRVYHK